MKNEPKCFGRINVITPNIELVRCQKCGNEIEIFADEKQATCDCGWVLSREKASCIEWCQYAEKCIGEEKYKELKEKKK